MKAYRPIWTLLVAILLTTACTKTVKVVDQRPSCNVCHSPRPAGGGEPHGIDEAHPWAELSCVDCHGGDDTAYETDEAHVQFSGRPPELRNMSAAELDSLDREYLRFVNPGDLRVAGATCGASGCHGDIVGRVGRSAMAHTAGEVTIARFRAGAQDSNVAEVGSISVDDPDFDERIEGTASFIERMIPPSNIDPHTASYAEIQDDYMAKSCFRCHVSDFGENRFPGDYRSSGCSACHTVYADDGVSLSADPTMDPLDIPRPLSHAMTSAIPNEQCMHCHYRGARIGPSYLGYRESAGSGFNPENPEVLGIAQHGHNPSYYLTDEDTEQFGDETPPDVHFEAGMGCVDCHTEVEVHGDGHIYGDTRQVVEIQCESCHGTIDDETTGFTRDGNPVENLYEAPDGTWMLRSKLVDGLEWEVTQIARSVDPTQPRHYSILADERMGRDANGFSHNDSMTCQTCHASWMPSCYGCHITMDYGETARVQTTGQVTTGRQSGERWWIQTDDQVLMINPSGLIDLSMPAERFFMTVIDEEGELVMEREPRRGPTGELAFGQRTVSPHTIQLRSDWSACNRCHIAPDGSNEELVRITVGLGSDRMIQTDGEGNEYRLDALMEEDGTLLVEAGHSDIVVSRPLSIDLAMWLLTNPVTAETASEGGEE